MGTDVWTKAKRTKQMNEAGEQREKWKQRKLNGAFRNKTLMISRVQYTQTQQTLNDVVAIFSRVFFIAKVHVCLVSNVVFSSLFHLLLFRLLSFSAFLFSFDFDRIFFATFRPIGDAVASIGRRQKASADDFKCNERAQRKKLSIENETKRMKWMNGERNDCKNEKKRRKERTKLKRKDYQKTDAKHFHWLNLMFICDDILDSYLVRSSVVRLDLTFSLIPNFELMSNEIICSRNLFAAADEKLRFYYINSDAVNCRLTTAFLTWAKSYRWQAI